VVEDQGVPPALIEAEFGPSVAAMVAALSERKQENGNPRPWEDRKKEALANLQQAGAGAMTVKAADVLHNAHSLLADLRRNGAAAWSHYARGPEQTLWYYHAVLEIVRGGLGAHPLLDEVEGAVRDLEQTISDMGVL
jgi:(p)ppGpp synthase/HD superfamily hydrolase